MLKLAASFSVLASFEIGRRFYVRKVTAHNFKSKYPSLIIFNSDYSRMLIENPEVASQLSTKEFQLGLKDLNYLIKPDFGYTFCMSSKNVDKLRFQKERNLLDDLLSDPKIPLSNKELIHKRYEAISIAIEALES